jgi:hypothetical protein
MEKEGLIYRYVGQVEELSDGKNGEVVLKDGKLHVFKDGWEELYLPVQDLDSEIREAVHEAEDSDLKQKLLEIFKKYDEMPLAYSDI